MRPALVVALVLLLVVGGFMALDRTVASLWTLPIRQSDFGEC